MNYRIIGTDGKIYGPVGAEKIREWLAQNRVDSRTAVFVDGTSDWTFIGLRPELVGPVPVIIVPPPTILPPRRTNGFATWSLVCALLSWTLCCCCCIPFNVFGLVFAIIALLQIHAHPDTQEGRGLAITGLVLSAANLFWCFGLTLFDLAAHPANMQWHIGN